LTKFFCFFLFTKRSFFLQLNRLILLAIFPDGRYFMSVTSTMTESLRMVRNQESFLLLFFKKDAFPFAFLLHEAKESERILF